MLERYLKFQIYVADKYGLSENLFSLEEKLIQGVRERNWVCADGGAMQQAIKAICKGFWGSNK